MSDLPCACGLTMADNCRCEAGDIAYTSELQDEVAKLRSDLSDATTECALWLDRASRHRAEIERLKAEISETRERLKPFADAFNLSVNLCKSRTLGDLEAMAAYHTPRGSFHRAAKFLANSQAGTDAQRIHANNEAIAYSKGLIG